MKSPAEVRRMERTGQVTAIHGEFLEITFCRPAECEHCHACLGGEAQRKLVVKGSANVGDTAVVEMPAKDVMKASAIAYLVPLAGLLAGLFAGAALWPAKQDLGAVLGGTAGLGLALAIVRMGENKRRNNPQWQPTLLRVVPMTKGE